MNLSRAIFHHCATTRSCAPPVASRSTTRPSGSCDRCGFALHLLNGARALGHSVVSLLLLVSSCACRCVLLPRRGARRELPCQQTIADCTRRPAQAGRYLPEYHKPGAPDAPKPDFFERVCGLPPPPHRHHPLPPTTARRRINARNSAPIRQLPRRRRCSRSCALRSTLQLSLGNTR